MVFVGGGFPFGDVIHLETVLAECFIDFVAYLEGGKGDAGAVQAITSLPSVP